MKHWLARLWPANRAQRAARLLRAGMAAEERGALDDAERAYRDTLAAAVDNVDAAYLLGRLCGQRGRLDEAEALLQGVIGRVPNFAPAQRDLALTLHALGRSEQAVQHYQQALRLDPADRGARLNLANLHMDQRNFLEAERMLRTLLALDPRMPGLHERLGYAVQQQGRAADAAQLLETALAARPSAETAYNLGVARQALGDSDAARVVFEQAVQLRSDYAPSLHALGKLALRDSDPQAAYDWLLRATDADPGNALARNDFGVACLQLRRFEEARENLDLAIALDPQHPNARFNRALVEIESRQYERAEQRFREMISVEPQNAEAHAGLGSTLQLAGRFEEAAASFRLALELAPQLPEALNNLGMVLQELGEFELAARQFEAALARRPGLVQARSNLGLAYLDLKRVDEALQCFEQALALNPQLEEARWNRAVARLRSGDFERGWDDYEMRWTKRNAVERPYRYPRWDGNALDGRSLLVYYEQGLGDEIMFASCYPELLEQNGAVSIECSPKLERLFARSFPRARVGSGERSREAAWIAASKVDCQIACGSLPALMRRSLFSFPAHRGYLRADPARVHYWRARLDALGPGPKIGLSWRGGLVSTRTRLRSLGLPDLLPVLRASPARFVSLQYTDCADEIAQLRSSQGIEVQHWQEAIDDYDETAALVSALDLVITVCTAVVHLGGALGRPVWVMVPFSPEWRYLDRGETMPWYPSVRLIRQPRPGDWTPVLNTVCAGLVQGSSFDRGPHVHA